MSSDPLYDRPISYEETTKVRPILFADDVRRLFWTLNGEISKAISVLEQPGVPDGPQEPYIRETPYGTSLHPVAQKALFEPKVSSITVRVHQFEVWEENWDEAHRHAELNDPDCIFANDIGDKQNSMPTLLRCCDEDRPHRISPLVVTPKEGQFVTVHDYVSSVHLWLMELRDDIISAKKELWGDTLREDELMVTIFNPAYLYIDEAERWMSSMRLKTLNTYT